MSIEHKYFAILLAFSVFFDSAKSLLNEDLAFHCDNFRYTFGSLFRKEGIALNGQIQKSTKASSLVQCGQLCLTMVEWCVSVNFELFPVEKNEDLKTCELSNFGVKSEQEISVGEKFEKRAGYVFNQIRPYKYGCSSQPCQNGATCYYDCAYNEARCRCPIGFTGKHCAENIDECNGVTCKNGGSCQDLVNNFTCACTSGYTGRYCEIIIDQCNGVTCQNGGSCQILVYNFTCTCISGYTGRYCEKNIDECNGVTCQNGGSCQDLVNNFTCACTSGYTGRYCEIQPICDIVYSTYSSKNVILYPLTKTLYAITVCAWLKMGDKRDQIPLSYLYSKYGLGLIYRSDSKLYFRIDSKGMTISMGVRRDNQWQHLCVAWRSTDGVLSTYRNGNQVANLAGFCQSCRITGGGNLNIGRRADKGAFFVGSMSNFNIWSSFLKSAEIKNLASSCQPLTNEGDVVAWSEVMKKSFSGDVQKICPGSC